MPTVTEIRLVEVDVTIDETRQDERAAEIEFGAAGDWRVTGSIDRGDALAGNRDRGSLAAR